jgi:ATP-dependent Clp protease ATP-binding subunit ClpC
MSGSQQLCDCELDLEQAKNGDLPRVCIRCGEPADCLVSTPLDYERDRITLQLPLCARHEDQWNWRGWATLGVFIAGGVLLLGTCGFVILIKSYLRASGAALLLIILLLALASFAFYGCLLLYTVLSRNRIWIRRLGATSVTLKCVSPDFARAYRIQAASRSDSASPLPAYSKLAESMHIGPESAIGEETILVFQAAAWEARESSHDYIGTRHLLVALRVVPTEAADALRALGIEDEQLGAARRSAASPAVVHSPEGELPYTPAVRRAISRAAVEAKERSHGSIRAAHLLLGILREPDNEAVQLLLELGISPEEAARRSAEAIRLLENVMVVPEAATSDAIVPESQSR